ncbi:MAG: hypothetical protein GC191_13625 [Azospirillum sp.]|nr:hypothetical protein [Azospirillum sp.]
MIDAEVARAVHVLAVVLWIGGVGFVTLCLLPYARFELPPQGAVDAFEAIERRFAALARFYILAAGASGLWMTVRYDLWYRFAEPATWWMHAMVAVWAAFAFVVFVAEPLFLHRWFAARAAHDPQGTLRRIWQLHVVLLTASLVTVYGALRGIHG